MKITVGNSVVTLWRVGEEGNEGQEFVNRPEMIGQSSDHSWGTGDPTATGLRARLAQGFVRVNQIVDHVAPESGSH